MKDIKGRKLHVSKTTITNLDKDEQKQVNGGQDNLTYMTTNTPIYC